VRTDDVLEVNERDVIGGDVITVEELPVAVVLVDDVDDRASLERDAFGGEGPGGRIVEERPRVLRGGPGPSAHRVPILGKPKLWLVESAASAAAVLPWEPALAVGPDDFDDGQRWTLAEPQGIAEQLRVPAVMDRKERHRDVGEDTVTQFIGMRSAPHADLLTELVEPVLHVGNPQAEHRGLGACERVPQPNGERPPRQPLVSADADHAPSVAFDVSHQLAVTVVPRIGVGRLVDDAVTIALSEVCRHRHSSHRR